MNARAMRSDRHEYAVRRQLVRRLFIEVVAGEQAIHVRAASLELPAPGVIAGKRRKRLVRELSAVRRRTVSAHSE